MACCDCSGGLCGFVSSHFSCVLPDGHCNRTSLSGLRDDEVIVLSCNGKSRPVLMDASNGYSDRRPHFLFSVESLCIGKKCQRYEGSDHCGDRSAGRAVYLADAPVFSRQDTICL